METADSSIPVSSPSSIPLGDQEQRLLQKLIKGQIQHLVDQLQQQTGMETVILLGRNDADLDRLGSKKGLKFLSSMEGLGSHFTEYLQSEDHCDDVILEQTARDSTYEDGMKESGSETTDQLTLHGNDMLLRDDEGENNIDSDSCCESNLSDYEVMDIEDLVKAEYSNCQIQTEIDPEGSMDDFGEMTHYNTNVAETSDGALTQEQARDASSLVQSHDHMRNMGGPVGEMKLCDFELDCDEKVTINLLNPAEETNLLQADEQQGEIQASVDEVGMNLPNQLGNGAKDVLPNDSIDHTGAVETQGRTCESNNALDIGELAEGGENQVSGALPEQYRHRSITNANDKEIIVGQGFQEAHTIQKNQAKNPKPNNGKATKKVKHVYRPFECKFCGKMFKSRSHLTDHLTTHDYIARISCKYCGDKFRWRHQRQRHIEMMHSMETGSKALAVTDENASKLCSSSGQSATSSKVSPLKTANEMKSTSPSNSKKLNFMLSSLFGKSDQKPNQLKKSHKKPTGDVRKTSKSSNIPTAAERKQFQPHPGPNQCKYCLKQCRTTSEMYEHMHKHTKVFTCWKCGRSLWKKLDQLRMHVRHCTKVPSAVQYKSSATPKSVVEHKASVEPKSSTEHKAAVGSKSLIDHKKVSVLKCSACSRSFMYQKVFRKHLLTCHVAEKHKNIHTEATAEKNTTLRIISEKTVAKKFVTENSAQKLIAENANAESSDADKNTEKANIKKAIVINVDATNIHEKMTNAKRINAESRDAVKMKTKQTETFKKTNKYANICRFCGRTFSAKFKLFRHLCKHTREKRFTCRFCQEKFRWVEKCKKHEEQYHKNDIPVRNMRLPISTCRELSFRNLDKCSFCGSDLGEQTFDVHIKVCIAFQRQRKIEARVTEELNDRQPTNGEDPADVGYGKDIVIL